MLCDWHALSTDLTPIVKISIHRPSYFRKCTRALWIYCLPHFFFHGRIDMNGYFVHEKCLTQMHNMRPWGTVFRRIPLCSTEYLPEFVRPYVIQQHTTAHWACSSELSFQMAGFKRLSQVRADHVLLPQKSWKFGWFDLGHMGLTENGVYSQSYPLNGKLMTNHPILGALTNPHLPDQPGKHPSLGLQPFPFQGIAA